MLESFKGWFRWRMEDLRARRRGEVRTAPDGIRGRIFAKRKSDGFGARARGKVKVEMLIKRADGTVERRKVPGSMSFFKH